MKKLYNHTKGKIHPSPPPSSTTTPYHHLSLLPITIATLAAALSPEDQQVLAYLLSITSGTKPTNKSGDGDHPPQFNCNCFTCYTSFWVRWDASPKRKLIHEIIDAYEDGLMTRNKKNGKKKDRKIKAFSNSSSKSSSDSSIVPHEPQHVAEVVTHAPPCVEQKHSEPEDEMESSEKGSVRKIVSFIGERIWGVWGV
ncbi:uncharacterized protein [Rutidosis leptorrhynchoides]|uniref:uncharacterized protein n=1 Tax=Rutidosis leptorrhynchoides TaxID=125765 RepID=UPI003A9A01EF